MSTIAIIAWYFIVLIESEYILIGPYDNKYVCMDHEEYITSLGFETETCTMMSTNQVSISLSTKK